MEKGSANNLSSLIFAFKPEFKDNSNMISVKNLSFSYGGHLVFDDVSFVIGENQKVGIVGPNGAGKTTLLNLIAKKIHTDLGTIEVQGSVSWVPQEVKHDPTMDAAQSVRDYLDPKNKMLDFEIKETLNGLELPHLGLKSNPQIFSGGQKTRLAIARALLANPDILLLDEPTNFLDVAGKKWVVKFLGNFPHTVIVISHDLDLLDQHIDKVLFIDAQVKKVEEYKGNYSQFLKLREAKITHLKKQIKAGKQHIESMEEGLKMKTQSVKQRIQLQRRIEREKAKLPELPQNIKSLGNFSLPEPTRCGEIPIKASNISKYYADKKILEDLNFYLSRGERVAFIGPNGAGKSTLIKILVGLLQPDEGQVIRDERLKLGYYSQEYETFDLVKSVFTTVQETTHLSDGKTRSALGKFMFRDNKVFQSVRSLSGGEKTRLAIALLVLQDYNLLVLDEPTTYLDVLSQRIILEALKNYTGAMIIVSHTEEFIQELAPSRVLLLPENRIDFWHNEYLAKVSEV